MNQVVSCFKVSAPGKIAYLHNKVCNILSREFNRGRSFSRAYFNKILKQEPDVSALVSSCSIGLSDF